MQVLDLFSGIGGFSLGLERAGMTTVAFCEQDEFCRKVLAKHWPDVPCHDDIRTLKGSDIGAIDLICGGPPCQPVSVAGQRRGPRDDRWLWPEMRRIIAETRPAYVIVENVVGLKSMVIDRGELDLESRAGGRTSNGVDYTSVFIREEHLLLGAICDEIGALGYTLAPLVIPACAVDAPHRRERVWIVAHSSHDRLHRGVESRAARGVEHSDGGPIMAHAARLLPGRQEQRAERQRVGPGGEPLDVPDAGEPGLPQSKQKNVHGERWREKGGTAPELRGRQPEPGLGGMADGLPGGLDGDLAWPAEPRHIPRVAVGVPNRVARLKALGNAVVPQVVEMIGRAIMAAETASP